MDYRFSAPTIEPWPDGQDRIGDWADTPTYRRLRHNMVRQQIIARGIRDANLIRAMAQLPRHLFICQEDRHAAYFDQALSSELGQTISQPQIVAVMTAHLAVRPGQRILEIGTGTGYQTALLAMLGAQVYTVEYLPQLSAAAQQRLQRLGFSNIEYHIGDGSIG